MLLVLIMLCEALGEVLHRGRRSDDDCVSVRLSVCLCRSTRRNITIFPICNMPSPAAASALQRVCGVGGRSGASCTMVPPLLGRRRLIMHEDILS